MQIKRDVPLKEGSYRIVRKFILFPKHYEGDTWRFLEYAYVLQVARNYSGTKLKWVTYRFADDKDMAEYIEKYPMSQQLIKNK